MSFIRIVGMDPSLRNWGVAQATLNVLTLEYVITDLLLISSEDEAGKSVRKNSDDLRRAKTLHEGMIKACEGVSLAIAEVPHGSQSARAMASYGMCVGVLSTCPIPLIQVSANEVKLAVTGKKVATKNEMIDWAMYKHPAAPWRMRKLKGQMLPTGDNEHLADAVASIEAGIKTQQFQQAIAVYKSMRKVA